VSSPTKDDMCSSRMWERNRNSDSADQTCVSGRQQMSQSFVLLAVSTRRERVVLDARLDGGFDYVLSVRKHGRCRVVN